MNTQLNKADNRIMASNSKIAFAKRLKPDDIDKLFSTNDSTAELVKISAVNTFQKDVGDLAEYDGDDSVMYFEGTISSTKNDGYKAWETIEGEDGTLIEVMTMGDVITKEALQKAAQDFIDFPVVREMHWDGRPVGNARRLWMVKQDGETHLKAAGILTDPDVIRSVQYKDYRAFSIGGYIESYEVVKNEAGEYFRRIDDLFLREFSVVDMPQQRDALIDIFRRAENDPTVKMSKGMSILAKNWQRDNAKLLQKVDADGDGLDDETGEPVASEENPSPATEEPTNEMSAAQQRMIEAGIAAANQAKNVNDYKASWFYESIVILAKAYARQLDQETYDAVVPDALERLHRIFAPKPKDEKPPKPEEMDESPQPDEVEETDETMDETDSEELALSVGMQAAKHIAAMFRQDNFAGEVADLVAEKVATNLDKSMTVMGDTLTKSIGEKVETIQSNVAVADEKLTKLMNYPDTKKSAFVGSGSGKSDDLHLLEQALQKKQTSLLYLHSAAISDEHKESLRTQYLAEIESLKNKVSELKGV